MFYSVFCTYSPNSKLQVIETKFKKVGTFHVKTNTWKCNSNRMREKRKKEKEIEGEVEKENVSMKIDDGKIYIHGIFHSKPKCDMVFFH